MNKEDLKVINKAIKTFKDKNKGLSADELASVPDRPRRRTGLAYATVLGDEVDAPVAVDPVADQAYQYQVRAVDPQAGEIRFEAVRQAENEIRDASANLYNIPARLGPEHGFTYQEPEPISGAVMALEQSAALQRIEARERIRRATRNHIQSHQNVLSSSAEREDAEALLRAGIITEPADYFAVLNRGRVPNESD